MWSYLRFHNSTNSCLFYNFRAYFCHFAQSKSTFSINWKLFSRFKSARISIFIEVLLILVELFMIFITVLIPVRFITSERILATLVEVNRLPLLIEFCSAGSKLPGSQFYRGTINTCRVMYDFHNSTNSWIFFSIS